MPLSEELQRVDDEILCLKNQQSTSFEHSFCLLEKRLALEGHRNLLEAMAELEVQVKRLVDNFDRLFPSS